MPWFFIITKILFIKILICLADVAAASGEGAYNFGYHPSAEEFDSLLRETRRTWTRDLLANERRRAWSARDVTGHFVPKYKYENERQRHSTTQSPWSGYAQKISYSHKPQSQKAVHRLDQQVGASSPVHAIQNVGSILNFTMFGDEDGSADTENSALAPHNSDENVVFSTALKTQMSGNKQQSSVKTQTVLNDNSIKISQLEKLNTSFPANISNASADAHLPIFFTNPVTGIVYAITEVGNFPGNPAQTNGSIPIFITKEQYDRDMLQLKKKYEVSCNNNTSNKVRKDKSTSKPFTSAVSGPMSTTLRPQIIRLQKPSKTLLAQTITKLPPTQLHRPPPVMVQTEVAVSDQVKLPIHRKKKVKTKTKTKKKKKRIGAPHRPRPVGQTGSVIRKPSPTNQTTTPQIILGTRTTLASSTVKPSVSTIGLSTQLEKPNLPISSDNNYNNNPFSSRSHNNDNKNSTKKSYPYPKYRIRRSLDVATTNNATQEPTKVIETSSTTAVPVITSRSSTISPNNSTEPRAHATNPTKRRKINTKNTKVSSKSPNKLQQSQKTLLDSRRKPNRTRLHSSTATVKPQDKLLLPTNIGTKVNENLKTKTRKKSPTKTKKRRKHHESDEYDIFGFATGDDDYDDDDEDDEAEVNKTHKGDTKDIIVYNYDTSSAESEQDPSYLHARPNLVVYDTSHASETNSFEDSEELLTDLKEEIPQSNSSSAEEDADFGALEENTSDGISMNTKSTYEEKRKRIRRRPLIIRKDKASNEDDEADDDDDDIADTGVGSFFRMIFYPVQMVMTRLLGSADDDANEDDTKPEYATYTLYNGASKVAAENESDENDDQSYSLTEWLSSWFGFNRKTKKIGSTTIAPIQAGASTVDVAAEEQGESGSWWSTLFGFGSSKNTASAEVSYEDYDDNDKWFFGWFDSKPKVKRKSITTTTPQPTPQVPILTIVDPLRNPQNWIGILAHHIINSTSTTTHNPLIEALTGVRTTEHPDIPHVVSYDKYQIWRLKPQDESQVKALEEFKQSEDGMRLQWLKGPSLRGLTDVLVPPKMFTDFQGTLSFESIAHEVLIFDVGKAIAYEKTREQIYYTTTQQPQNNHKAPPVMMSWSKYYDYDDILKYLESIRIRHPQMIELIHIGRSYEGRPLVIVKIESKELAAATSSAVAQAQKKLKYKKKSAQANAVFIESGAHGLEWIGPATSTWMVNELLRIMKSNKTNDDTKFIKDTVWYIMPVLNPDGYVYSHDYDRFWKKSRSRHISRPTGLINSAMTWLQQKKVTEKICYGVDLDRNWHYQWGRRGSSKSPCNEFYAGPSAFSEPETKALSEFLMDYRKQIKLYISMQAYGQIISYPIRMNVSFNNERLDDFHDVAMVGTDGLRKKGSKSRYKIDSTNDLTEHRSGCSDAFAAYEVGIPFSYTLQLADNGVHGYLLPSSSIEPTAKDAFEIITAMLDYI